MCCPIGLSNAWWCANCLWLRSPNRTLGIFRKENGIVSRLRVSVCRRYVQNIDMDHIEKSMWSRARTGLFMFLIPKGSLIVYRGKMYEKSKYANLTNLTVAVFPKITFFFHEPFARRSLPKIPAFLLEGQIQYGRRYQLKY